MKCLLAKQSEYGELGSRRMDCIAAWEPASDREVASALPRIVDELVISR